MNIYNALIKLINLTQERFAKANFTQKDYDKLGYLISSYDMRLKYYNDEHIDKCIANSKLKFISISLGVGDIYNPYYCLIKEFPLNLVEGRIRAFVEEEVECLRRLMTSRIKDISLIRLNINRKISEIASRVDTRNLSLKDLYDPFVNDKYYIAAIYESFYDIYKKVHELDDNTLINIKGISLSINAVNYTEGIGNTIKCRCPRYSDYLTSQNFNDLFDMIKPGLESLLQRYPEAKRLVRMKMKILTNKVNEKSLNNKIYQELLNYSNNSDEY